MNTSIAIDTFTRDKAAKRARMDRIPLSTIVRVLLMDYAEGKISIGTRIEESAVEILDVDDESQKKMDEKIACWDLR
jgi:hypothetical protein